MTRDPLDDWIDAEKYPAATQRCQIHGTYVGTECPRCPEEPEEET